MLQALTAMLQSVMLASILLVVLRVSARIRWFDAAWRASLGVTAIAMSVALPVLWMVAVAGLAESPARGGVRAAPRAAPVMAERRAVPPAGVQAPPATAAGTTIGRSAFGLDRQQPVFAVPARAATACAVVWGAIVFALLVRIAVRHRRVQQRLRLLPEPDDATRARLARLIEPLGLPGRVAFRICPESRSPAVAGLWRPIIVLRVDVAGESDDDLRAVLAHELAHLARRDNVLDAVMSVALAFGFFNPGLWVLRRDVVADREVACDDMVVRSGAAEPRAYARLLVRLSSAHPAAGIAASAAFAMLERRVKSIVASRDRTSRGSGWIPGVLLAAAFWLATNGFVVSGLTVASASPDATLHAPVGATQSVVLRNGHGRIDVMLALSDELKASGSVHAAAAGIVPGLVRDGAELVLCAVERTRPERCADGAIDGSSIDWSVAIPGGRALAVSNVDGTIRVRTSGAITVRSVASDIDAVGTTVDALTSSGSIVAGMTSTRIAPRNPWLTLEARKGTVTLAVAPLLRAWVVASSIHGGVGATFPISVGKQPGYDWLIGRARLNGAGEREKVVVIAGGDVRLETL